MEDPDEVAIRLSGLQGEIMAPVRPAFAARMSHLILHAARNHMGFVRVARPIVADDLANGRLVELLPETPPVSKPFYLVTSSAFSPSRRSDVFLREVETRVRVTPGIRFAGASLA
jgi:DNA-binding transcriptional LysR family regulator